MALSTRCYTDGGLYVYRETGTTNTTITESSVRTYASSGGSTPFSGGLGWARLPHTKSVSLSPDVTEPDKIRTSDTGGIRVPGCASSVSYSCDVTSYLSEDDWLWWYLLSDPTQPGNLQNPTRWFCITKNITLDTNGNTPDVEGATFVLGRVTPGGFEFDNESDTPQSTDWTISVQGLVFPGVSLAAAVKSAPLLQF